MLDDRAVQDELERVVASGGFANSPRMSRFLRFVVEETMAGRAGHLKEYSVGVNVFDKTESYDPAVDPTVRVEAAKLRAKLARTTKATVGEPRSSSRSRRVATARDSPQRSTASRDSHPQP